MKADAEFVKSATTSVSPADSQAEIIAILGRYGATGFGFRKRPGMVSVTFHMPRAKGDIREDHEVEIPIRFAAVEQKLNAPALQEIRAGYKKGKQVPAEQVERVAWRVLKLWIDASLSAVSLGATTLEDAFFAHLIVTDTKGQRGRLADYVNMLEQVAPGGKFPALGTGGFASDLPQLGSGS